MSKCQFPEGAVDIRIGNTELDPCKYVLTEKYKNVTVEVLKCPVCGDVSIGWYKQDNTEEISLEGCE